MKLNDKVLSVFEKIEAYGYDVYLVGGCVRDFLLKRPIHDYDIVTTASLEIIKSIFKELHFIDYQKGQTVGLIYDGFVIDISSTFDKTIEEDLLRRNFTINMLLYHPKKGITDFYGVRKDLEEGMIRTYESSEDILNEDPNRILRAIRFEAELGFSIDPALHQNMLKLAPRLKDIAPERIRDEFSKIIMVDQPSRTITKYILIFGVFIPQLLSCKGFLQHNPYHSYDVFEHIMKVLDATEANLVLRLAAFLHDIEKPACFSMDEKGIGHFYDHYEVSAVTAKKLLRKLHYSLSDVQRVYKLVLNHDKRVEPSDKKLLQFLASVGVEDIDLLFKLKRADIIGQNPRLIDRLVLLDQMYDRICYLIEQKKFITKELLQIKAVDLIEIGYLRDGILGETLNELLKLVQEGTLKNERKELLSYAKEKLSKKMEN